MLKTFRKAAVLFFVGAAGELKSGKGLQAETVQVSPGYLPHVAVMGARPDNGGETLLLRT